MAEFDSRLSDSRLTTYDLPDSTYPTRQSPKKMDKWRREGEKAWQEVGGGGRRAWQEVEGGRRRRGGVITTQPTIRTDRLDQQNGGGEGEDGEDIATRFDNFDTRQRRRHQPGRTFLCIFSPLIVSHLFFVITSPASSQFSIGESIQGK